jgi:translation initiation factor IF-2
MNMNESNEQNTTEGSEKISASSAKTGTLRMGPTQGASGKSPSLGSKKTVTVVKKRRRVQGGSKSETSSPTPESPPSSLSPGSPASSTLSSGSPASSTREKEKASLTPDTGHETPPKHTPKNIDIKDLESTQEALRSRLKNSQEEAEKKAEERKQQQEQDQKVEDIPLDITPDIAPTKTQEPERVGKNATNAREKHENITDEERKSSQKIGKVTQQRRQGKLTISQALSEDDESEERTRSLSAILRKREKERQQSRRALEQKEKIVRDVIIPETITVGELSSRMTERVGDVIKKLISMGVMASSSSEIDADTAELVVEEFQHKVRRVADSDVESFLEDIDIKEENIPEEPRPPVVTVMGHVDHGKTSLLDALRHTRIQASEAGGITQRISAYQITVTKEKRQITFIDTPGHEAFTAMRARGANVTDIVILIVAADAGVMPQTREAISHAQAANVPIVVAINKIDLPSANIEKIYHQLLEASLVPEHLGGDILCVPISTKTGEGLDKLLSHVLLQADLHECKSAKNEPAKGSVLEAYVDKGRGCVMTLLVTRGTLKVGDVFVVGTTWGKVRSLYDDNGKKIKKALPSQPVEVLGAGTPPKAGDTLQVMPPSKESRAASIAEYRQTLEDNKRLNKASHVESLDAMFDRFHEKSEQRLTIVVKADVQGIVEAIVASLANLEDDHCKIRILHAGVGPVNASDIALASTSNGMIIAFGVRVAPEAQKLARQHNIEIARHSIIHHLLEEIQEIIQKRKEPEIKEILIGTAEVRDVFDMGRRGKVAGCAVINGTISHSGRIVITRDEDDVLYEGKIKQLRRFRDDVASVSSGYECGISCEGFEDYAVGDRIACYGQESSQG